MPPGAPTRLARALTGLEMLACVLLMASGAVLAGLGWALGNLYAVAVGALAVALTPLRMLHVQGVPGPLDGLIADD